MKNRHLIARGALVAALASLSALPALAKLPPPSDEAKAKAAEAAAKTAHGNKVANFQLCKSMDKNAAAYFAQAKKDSKEVKPAEKTEACADPGPFAYTPSAAAPATGAAATAATAVAAAPPPAAPAPAPATAPKK